MATRTFCDACKVELTVAPGAVSVHVPVTGTSIYFTAAPDLKGWDICEQCIYSAFARKLPHAVLNTLARDGIKDDTFGRTVVMGIDYGSRKDVTGVRYGESPPTSASLKPVPPEFKRPES